MKTIFAGLLLFISQTSFSQNERITVIDRNPETEVLFDETNPLSFVNFVAQNFLEMDGMDEQTLKAILPFTSRSSLSYSLGPQSDIPLANIYGEDSIAVFEDFMVYVYPPQDTSYFDLTGISRLVIYEGEVNTPNGNHYFGITRIGFAKQYKGTNNYYITGTLNYSSIFYQEKYYSTAGIDLAKQLVNGPSEKEILATMEAAQMRYYESYDREYYDARIQLMHTGDRGYSPFLTCSPVGNTYRSNDQNLYARLLDNTAYGADEAILNHFISATFTKKSQLSDIPYVTMYGEDSIVTLEDGTSMYVYPTYDIYYWTSLQDLKTAIVYQKNYGCGNTATVPSALVFYTMINDKPYGVYTLVLDPMENESQAELSAMIRRILKSMKVPQEGLTDQLWEITKHSKAVYNPNSAKEMKTLRKTMPLLK